MRAFALGLLFVSVSALACPDFSGKYAKCVTEGEVSSTNLVVSQQAVNGGVSYTATSIDAKTGETSTDTFLANGEVLRSEQTDPESGTPYTIVMVSACVGNALKSEIGVIVNNQLVSHVLIEITKSGNELKTVTTGTKQDQTLNETAVCQ